MLTLYTVQVKNFCVFIHISIWIVSGRMCIQRIHSRNNCIRGWREI